MSNLTTIIDQISTSQANKESKVNALIDAASPGMIWGRHDSATAGLTWGVYGGNFDIAGTPTQIANQTIALTNNATNYLYVTSAGVLTKVTSAPAGWPGPLAAGAVALYVVTTVSSVVTNYVDWREGIGRTGATGATGAAGSNGSNGSNGTNGTNWSVSVNAQTGTTYTLVSGDNGVVVTLSNASAITVTIASGLGANFACELIQLGAGQVTIAAGGGVTLNTYASLNKIAGQHGACTLIAYAADVFNLSGNLSL